MAFLVLGANSVSGYTVKNSLRFNAGSSDYLNRTPSSAGNRRTWTYSCWVKKVKNDTVEPGNYPALLTAGNDGTEFYFLQDTGQLQFYYYTTSYIAQVRTNAYFRDLSAWYHVVLAVDTTQATSTDRIKIYVNGTLQTLTIVNTVPQNTDMDINNNVAHYIGRYSANGSYPPRWGNYYLSEVNFVNAQQLDATSFGQTDTDTGIWIPKAYTGTYGTNGFYLKFANSASLGTDSSGNGNNFTVNNLTSIDQTTDTPTNNFATLNPLLYSTSISYTEGNLKFTNTSSGQRMVASSIAPTTGKWYAECRVTSLGGTYPQVGVLDTSIYTMDTYVGALARGYGYASHGQVYNNAGALTTGLATYTTNDIIGVALDLDNNYVYFSKNGTFINSGVPTSGSSGTGGWAITDGYDYSFGSSSLDSGTDPVFDWNFGSPFYTANSYTDGAGYGNFSYAVPSGYYALCTKNLANYG